jgi:hypothetical protein
VNELRPRTSAHEDLRAPRGVRGDDPPSAGSVTGPAPSPTATGTSQFPRSPGLARTVRVRESPRTPRGARSRRNRSQRALSHRLLSLRDNPPKARTTLQPNPTVRPRSRAAKRSGASTARGRRASEARPGGGIPTGESDLDDFVAPSAEQAQALREGFVAHVAETPAFRRAVSELKRLAKSELRRARRT